MLDELHKVLGAGQAGCREAGEARDEDAREELGHVEPLQARVLQLLIGEAHQVVPVYGKTVQLEIIGSNEPQYSVNHGQPPEHFKQLLPKAVKMWKRVRQSKKRNI